MDWLQFNPQRIKEPGVIIGLIIIVIGIILLASANKISQKIAQRFSLSNENSSLIVRFASMFVVLIGCLVAILTI